MVRKLRFFSQALFLSLSLIAGVVGCTVAVPDASSLAEISLFSSKSESPYNQRNPGEVIFLSGTCLPGVTGFEFRLNGLSIWSPVDSIAPSPDSSQGEYLVGSPDYDLDCSDGDFDFYVFKSTAMANLAANNTGESPGDPASIELRATGIDGLPTLLFERPQPSAFAIKQDYYDNWDVMETGRTRLFTLQLLDASGDHAMVPSGSSVITTINVKDLDTSSTILNSIYNSSCSTKANPSDLTFDPGDDEITLCYKDNGVTTEGHAIRIEASASGIISNYFDIAVKKQDSVITSLFAPNGNDLLPPTFLKDVNYTLVMAVAPVFKNIGDRSVSSFMGNFTISSAASTVSFMKSADDTGGACPSTPQSQNMTCTATGWGRTFTLKVGSSYPGSRVYLDILAIPQASCASGCAISDSGSTINITDYVPTQTSLEVVDGPNLYNQPYFRPHNLMMRTGECASIDLALANVNGTVIPGFTKTLSINSNVADIYSAFDCNPSSLITTLPYDYNFSTDDLVKQVYYKIDTMPSDGKVEWTINDGTTTWTKVYYVEKNNSLP